MKADEFARQASISENFIGPEPVFTISTISLAKQRKSKVPLCVIPVLLMLNSDYNPVNLFEALEFLNKDEL